MKLNLKRLSLGTVRGVRLAIAKCTRDMYAVDEDDPLDAAGYRRVLDGLKLLLAAYKTESDMRLEDEVKLIREALKRKNLL